MTPQMIKNWKKNSSMKKHSQNQTFMRHKEREKKTIHWMLNTWFGSPAFRLISFKSHSISLENFQSREIWFQNIFFLNSMKNSSLTSVWIFQAKCMENRCLLVVCFKNLRHCRKSQEKQKFSFWSMELMKISKSFWFT